MYGEKLFPQSEGYPTPTSIPDETTCLTLNVPANEAWWGIIVGVLYSLTLEWNWQQLDGGLDRDEVAARWQIMLEDALEVASTTNTCGVPPVAEAPFWDDADAADAGDDQPIETQPWYEDVADVVVTAFLATIITPAGAINFVTIARKLRFYFRKGEWGGIFKIFLDGDEVATVDTYAETDALDYVDVLVSAA